VNTREQRFYEVLPYGLLAASTAVSAAVQWDRGDTLWIVAALALAAAAWIAWWRTLHPEWSTRSRRMGVFYVGYAVLMGALVGLAPWFGFAAFVTYFYVSDLAKRWQMPAAAAAAVLIGTAQAGGWPGTEYAAGAGIWAALVTINLAVAGGMMRFALQNEERNRERDRTLAELEASLSENAALQAQLVERAREAGVTEERERMAREIHDTLAQGLTGIVTQLEAARSGRDATRRIEAAIALARQSLSEARRSVHALRPEPLVGARLPDAVAQVARDWSELHGVPAQVTTTGDAQPMHPDVEVVLLRAAQEALANVGRHAGASRVGLTLSYMGDVVTLDVRDDGVGFTPNGVNGG
jgi:signal transduction histidine kinase